MTDNLGGQGLFGVELFVKGEQVWFSEVSPRPHDTGMVTMVTQWQNEFELHARAILGLPIDTALKSAGASAVIYGGVEARGIVFDGVDEALRVPHTELRLFGKPESFKKRRVGVALAPPWMDSLPVFGQTAVAAKAAEISGSVLPVTVMPTHDTAA